MFSRKRTLRNVSRTLPSIVEIPLGPSRHVTSGHAIYRPFMLAQEKVVTRIGSTGRDTYVTTRTTRAYNVHTTTHAA